MSTTLWNSAVSPWEAPGGVVVDSGWSNLHLATMEHLGASVEELAKETIESIMGASWKGGHKPPRADIQKMKDALELHRRAQNVSTGEIGLSDPREAIDAANEWDEKYGLTQREISMTALYQRLLTHGKGELRNPQAAFSFVVKAFSSLIPKSYPEAGHSEEVALGLGSSDPGAFDGVQEDPEVKKEVGTAIKKYEQQSYPMLYTVIDNSLAAAYRRGPYESYKLWPRMVTWIKDEYQDWLKGNTSYNNPNQSPRRLNTPRINHIVDITLEGGKILNQLRQDNRIPQNFDANKLGFPDFEEWLMGWKRENLGSEHAGEIVYQFHDGWTVQKLTTPEQLQYEGDEMGHCVGGYASDVEHGSTIIYSLRDPKGVPHVTMEVEANEGYTRGPDKQMFDHEYVHPDKHEPGVHTVPGTGDTGLEGQQGTNAVPTSDHPFDVVQIQGNSNNTPKPEYQRKIKEFIDALKAKGWKFQRSENWFHNFDDPRQNEYGVGSPDNAQKLDEWYDNHYKTHYKDYHGGDDHQDVYGLPGGERMTPNVSDWETMFREILGSLVEDYDQGCWRTRDWAGMAQAVYHAWMVDTYKDKLTPEQLEKYKQNLLDEVQRAEDTLWEWEIQNSDNHHQYGEKFKEIAQRNGVWPEVEKLIEQELGEEGIYASGEYEKALEAIAHEPKYEDFWLEARDEVADEVNKYYSENARLFCNYLHNLVYSNGAVNPADLPDPNERHGGLPSYDDLMQKNGLEFKDNEWQQIAPGPTDAIPGTFSHWREATRSITIHPIDQEHNVWFDEDGNQRVRYRPGWAKHPETGKMEQSGALEDTFLDKQGRQGQGVVAYHGDTPVGSTTWVSDPNGWHMIGTTFVHPEYRQQGIFNQMTAPLRESGQPIDAYVWNNPWLKNKVRGWQQSVEVGNSV